MNKNVLNKLAKIESKVELSEMKVDLALIDDVKKSYADAIAARKRSFDEMQLVGKKIIEAAKIMQDIIKINEGAISAFDKFEVAAKSIGIDVPKDILDQKKNIQEGLKGTLAKYTKNLNSIKLF